MDSLPISESFLKFISDNQNENATSLRLRYHGKISEFDMDFAITQIECRKKFRKKLHSFISDERFIFPSTLSGEQASHELVANFHASLFNGEENVIDMTAGLGIDAMTIASKVNSILACELDPLKAKCLLHNKTINGIGNMKVENTDSIEKIKADIDSFDTVFIDPARRDSNNSRVYNFHDCQPDILAIQDHLFNNSKKLIIKASPLLDISQTLTDIPNTSAIRCVSVDGECKEVLIEAENKSTLSILEAINIRSDGNIISRFTFNNDDNTFNVDYASASDLKKGCYLYEPDASVMKLSPWGALTKRYSGIKKLGKSSHLFLSNELFGGFPGRILRFQGIIEKKDRKALKGVPVNVATRNYPMSSDELRKKLGVKEGKDTFIFGTKIDDKPILLLAERQTIS